MWPEARRDRPTEVHCLLVCRHPQVLKVTKAAPQHGGKGRQGILGAPTAFCWRTFASPISFRVPALC